MKFEEEIQQEKFEHEYHRAHLNVIFTAAVLSYETTQVLKPYQLTWQQFNILRILKGRHPQPATVKMLGERMIDKMSNASRLVDKLEANKLVERVANEIDRRSVDITLTEKGLQLLEVANKKIGDFLNKRQQNITTEETEELNRILNKMRGE